MKSSKDSKGDGSKQPKGGGNLEMGALFPRLHVKETKNAGPRAPPRNKMALYEQLTIPAHTYVSPPEKPASATQTKNTLSYPRQCPYNGGLVVPMYMTAPTPFPALGVGHCAQGQPSIATHTSNEAEVERVPTISRPAGNSTVSPEVVPSLTTSLNVRDKNVPRLGRMAEEDFTVPTFSSDKMSQSALTDCHLEEKNLSHLQPPGQNVDGTNVANLTRDSSKSGDYDIPQLQSQSGIDEGLSLKSSKGSKKSIKEDKIEVGSVEIGQKECGAVSKAIISLSSKDQSCSSPETQWHDSNRSGSSLGYHSGNVRLESLASHQVSGNEGSAPGDILEVIRQNNLESSNNSSRVLRVSEDVSNNQRLDVSGSGESIREVASLLVREAEDFYRSFSNNSEGSGDVENQTDGSGVEVSELSQRGGEGSEDSDSSMVDSSPLGKVSPMDVIGAVGQHEFWRMRKAILKQQRIFAMQLFELHRLVKVQEIMADTPALQSEEIADCPPVGELLQKDLESLGTREISTAKDEEKEAKEVDKQKEDRSIVPAIVQVSCPPEPAYPSSPFIDTAQNISEQACPLEPAHHSSPFIDNSQNISEQQARIYAPPYSFPIIPGQANAWGYTPYPHVGVNHWVGAMAGGSAAYGYQPYGTFSPFHPSPGTYNGPYGPMFGVHGPFEVRPMYPLMGYEHRPEMYSDVYRRNGPSPNQNWHSPMCGGSAVSSDGINPACSPYISPFADAGQRDRSDFRGYVDRFASTQGPPAVAQRSGQVGPSGLAGEPSTDRLDTSSMEASRWNGSQFYVQQGEHYAPSLGHQLPMYYAPRGIFPGLHPGYLEHDQEGQLRGQTISDAACSSDDMPSEKPFFKDNMELEQDKLFKRPRDGSHTGRMIQHEDKLVEKGTYTNARGNATDMTQDRLPVFPWGSSFSPFNHGRPHMSGGQHERVIKVVPRSMAAAPESAAEILHSIQQERQG